ncbi:hypothetical protein SAMN05660653_01082 [Desulfonatronum thiosulfatophilum]|uniref:Secreted protein n=1 Tax=Desulfonatronum thiosulfatophilum TaxID=617002 RepID=A0A1G6BNU1_9BACT|nr:hypothetical protein [Desulfonatronum thiosulfatophilum]SDB22322.1 hypothetical protein SAMN05660653_01082 [Desulfonatronum thiosulfatophilum]
MFGKMTVPLLVLAACMFLGAACGPDQEEYELPVRPGERPSGYEQPTSEDRQWMQPEAPTEEPGSNRDFQTDGQEQEQGAPFDARPTQ